MRSFKVCIFRTNLRAQFAEALLQIPQRGVCGALTRWFLGSTMKRVITDETAFFFSNSKGGGRCMSEANRTMCKAQSYDFFTQDYCPRRAQVGPTDDDTQHEQQTNTTLIVMMVGCMVSKQVL